MPLDPRLNAFRDDLADIRLRGRVAAARFAEGEGRRVRAEVAPVRRRPEPDASLETEALFGERVRVFEVRDGWAWGQLESDSYVGWLPADLLGHDAAEPTHRVTALRTLVFPAPDIKRPPLQALPLGARVCVVGAAEDRNARYRALAPQGFVVEQHLAPVGTRETDPVAVAQRFLGAPYLWGGKTSLGIDCSGLVQVALAACGIFVPRDTDLQEREIGEALQPGPGLPALQRGDLVFWRGHVGILQDPDMLLHANAHHMSVAVEPLADALAQHTGKGLAVTAVRRIASEAKSTS